MLGADKGLQMFADVILVHLPEQIEVVGALVNVAQREGGGCFDQHAHDQVAHEFIPAVGAERHGQGDNMGSTAVHVHHAPVQGHEIVQGSLDKRLIPPVQATVEHPQGAPVVVCQTVERRPLALGVTFLIGCLKTAEPQLNQTLCLPVALLVCAISIHGFKPPQLPRRSILP